MSSCTSEDTTTKREDFTPSNKRMKRRQVSLPKVRRNLFGPVDHETTDDFLKKELDILTDRSNCRWNFDFSIEKPLEGKWSWEVVRPEDVPSVYRTVVRVGYRVTENKDPRRNPLFPVTPGDNRLQDLSSVGCSTRSTNDKSTQLQDKQTSLKGFLSVRKRKFKSDLKISNKSHLIQSKRNSKANSKSPFTQVSSSLPNSASQDGVGD